MKKLIFFMSIFLATASICFAEQKYNPHEGRWETVPSNSELRYNPHQHEWSYQQPSSQLEYNPYEHNWEWQEPECQPPSDYEGQVYTIDK